MLKIIKNTAGKHLGKTRKQKEIEIENKIIKNKKWFSNVFIDKYKELKLILKSLNRNSNNPFVRTKFHQLNRVHKNLYRQILQKTYPNNSWNLLKQLKTSGKLKSNKMKCKTTSNTNSLNSFNNDKIKPSNKINLDKLNSPFDIEEIKQRIRVKVPTN